MNLRETILAASDRKLKSVDVEEWGVTVYVTSLSAGDAIALSTDGAGSFASRLLAATLADEKGALLFSDPADAEQLMKKDFRVIERLLDASRKHNGLSEEPAKNSTAV